MMKTYYGVLSQGTAASVLGNALSVDGVNEYIDTSIIIVPTANFSYGFWIKSTSNDALDRITGTISTSTSFFGLIARATDSRFDFDIRDLSNNRIDLKQENSTLGTWNDGDWHHILVSKGGNTVAGINIYFDGALQTMTTVISGTLSNATPFTHSLFLGASNNVGSALNPVAAVFDEVIMYDEALTANDALDLYAAGAGLYVDIANTWPTDGGSVGTNVKLIYHLDESSGTTVTDSSGEGNTGTAVNTEDIDWVDGIVYIP